MALPEAFIWTKMGVESGEALAGIIQRKEYERHLGRGVFAWGIGNALGAGPAALMAATKGAMAVFSPMPSKPKAADVAPGSVLLWTAYEDADGAAHPLPAHMIVTSRGNVAGGAKARHYALFCRSDGPLALHESAPNSVAPTALRNLLTGKPLGASQVTAVVRCGEAPTPGARAYPVAFTAALANAGYAKLMAPRALTAAELAEMGRAHRGGLDVWAAFVQSVRRVSPTIGLAAASTR